jgi:ribosomal protein S20
MKSRIKRIAEEQKNKAEGKEYKKKKKSSVVKREELNKKRNIINTHFKTLLKNKTKKNQKSNFDQNTNFDEIIASTYKIFDKIGRRVYHNKNIDRKKSRFVKKINQIKKSISLNSK